VATYIALLRAINVGGNAKLPMADLRAFFAKIGFADAQTLLQTGNVIFHGSKKATASLERLLEAEAVKRLSLKTDFMVRTAPEWAALVTANPFPDMAAHDPGHLLVMFLKDAADPKKVKALQAVIKGREIVRAKGKDAYITFPDGVGRSRLTNAVLERSLGTSSTGRNWNTVLKIAAAAAA
jgi:uncharacterized protein (DUF1697 family)